MYKEIAIFNKDAKHREMTKGILTYTDSKKIEHMIRLTPRGWNELMIFSTTDAVLMKLLFGTLNQNLQGVNAMQGTLNEKSGTNHKLHPNYLTKIL